MVAVPEQAVLLHQRAHVVDAAVTLLLPESIEQDLVEARTAGIDLAFVTVGTPKDDFRRTIDNLARWYQAVREHPDDLALITSISEFDAHVVDKAKVGI